MRLFCVQAAIPKKGPIHLPEFSVFLRGLLIGFSIAAPVGPIGILCIRRTLTEGRLAGFLSGMGAASADMIYGAVAAFGLTAVQELLLGQSNWLGTAGGLFLLYLGIRTFFSKPADESPKPSRGGLLGAYFATFLLTITNPITILSFIVIFAGLQLGSTNGNYFSASLMVLGVFMGSALWWFTLSFLVGLVKDRFDDTWKTRVNRFAGAIISGFGVAVFIIK
jgi:threonine/homoserine/homoserine lactone efflux protein